MSRRLLRTGRLRLFLVVVAALLVAGGAFAYITATGNGAGTAAAGTVSPVTITGGVSPTSHLFPGTSGDVTVHISNPNTMSVRLPSLELDTTEGTGGFDVDGGHSGCNLASLGFTTQDNGGDGWDVPVSGLDLDLVNAISMTTAAANACQSASFTVYLKVGP